MFGNVSFWAPLCLVALASCTRADARRQRSELPHPGDHHYGIYLNGAKVGWMRNRVAVADTVGLDMELHASVGGMGTVTRVELHERREYDKNSGLLLEIEFVQSAVTGDVRVRGKRRGDVLDLDVTAGGASRKLTVPVTETLDDAMTAERLARDPVVGATATSQRYDPSIQKLVRIEHRITAVEKRMFAGVAVDAVEIQSKYPELGIHESSWLDRAAKVLESRVGGFFVARLEPREQARRLDYQQDVLINAVVATPKPVSQSEKIDKLRLRMRGFSESVPPSSPRQRVTRQGQTTVLDLARDQKPGIVPLAKARQGADASELESTPFIQSDAPEIRAAARKAIGDAKDVFTASSRLASFVYQHVNDEYVPAYSNALEALKTRRGDCTEHSVLFVALARSLGIPARVAVGVAYWPPGKGFGWHAWAEVLAGGSWYSVDPTWGQAIADATHIKLAAGDPAEQARIVMLLGQLRIDSLEIL